MFWVVKKTIAFNYRVDNMNKKFWQISGRLYGLVNKFWAVCKVFTFFFIVNHIGMHDFNINKTSFCSSDEGLSSLMHNLRVLFAFANQLFCDMCLGSHTTKYSLQIPDFIDFDLSSRYYWSFLSTFIHICGIWQLKLRKFTTGFW